MYEKYFGFQRPPFELVPDPDFLFLGQSHDAALANLVMGIDSGKGFVAISGPVGAGKTTVLRALLRRLARGERVCYLAQPELNTADMLRAVLDGFGIQPFGGEVPDLRRALREAMRAGTAPGILIIDEAHLLSVDALEQIRLLSNLEEEDRKLLQIILSGQPELKQVLSSERLRPLAQRIEMFYEIEALDLADTQAYLERRIRIAGNPDTVKFEPAAVALIHECSGGIPRLINILADRTLVTAYVEETGQITDGLVTDAYHDLGEVTQSVMPGSPRTRRGFQRTSRFTPEKTARPRVEPVREDPPPVASAPKAAPPEPAEPAEPPEPVRASSAELTLVRDPMPIEPPRPAVEEPADDTPAAATPAEEAPVDAPAPAARPELAAVPDPAPTSATEPDTEAPTAAPPAASAPAAPPAASPEPVESKSSWRAEEKKKTGRRVEAEWEGRKQEYRAEAVPPKPSSPGLSRGRSLAGMGVLAIIVLAMVSLGNRHFRGEAAAEAPALSAAPPATASSEAAGQESEGSAREGAEAAPGENASADPASTEAGAAETGSTGIGSTGPGPDGAGVGGSSESAEPRFGIVAASFRTEERAAEFARRVTDDLGLVTRVSPMRGETGTWHRVLVGSYSSKSDVVPDIATLRQRYDLGFLHSVKLPSEGGGA